MVALLTILCLILGLCVGYICGVLSERKQPDEDNEDNEDNCTQIQVNEILTDEILLDADTNREISDIMSSVNNSPKNKILNDLIKMINNAAQNGQKILRLEYEYDLNKKVHKYLTKSDVKNFFESNKYKVEFKYSTLGYSDIEYISWE